MNTATHPEIYDLLFASGLTVYPKGLSLSVTPGSGMSTQTRSRLQQHKSEILDYLNQRSNDQTNRLITFQWDEEEIDVWRYDDSVPSRLGGIISLDCETEVIQNLDRSIPGLALVAVSDGHHHLCIHPDDLAAFVRNHKDRHFVFHNAAFDFWVVDQHLANGGNHDAKQIWIELANRRRMHDTMHFDRLIQIANGAMGEFIKPRDLAEVANRYAGLSLTKDDPFRMRYAEIIGKEWTDVDDGFFRYAAKDPIATIRSYVSMHKHAMDLMHQSGFSTEPVGHPVIIPDAVDRFGPLTEAIQTNAAIALAQISRNGLTTDQSAVRRFLTEIKRDVDGNIYWIDKNYPGIFKRDKQGRFILSKVRQQPSVLENELKTQLSTVFHNAKAGGTLPSNAAFPQTIKQEDWAPYLDQNELARKWFAYQSLCKQSDVLSGFNTPIIHSRFETLKVTGRTGSSSPNVQNVPRENRFRELIVPSDGHFLLIVDYSFIELVTLAATLRVRFGTSKLAEVIENGIDPHCYTAAMLLKMGYQEFLDIKKTDPLKFKIWRQRSKVINFGVPGGMGPSAIVEYARATFETNMSLEDATRLSRLLTEVIYPELRQYLSDKSMEALASNLGVSVETVWGQLDFKGDRPDWLPGAIKRVVSGKNKANGETYKKRFLDGIWGGLATINQNPRFNQQIASRIGSEELADQLFFEWVATISGRVRGGVRYTTAKNTPFQGLAADGANIAQSRLVFQGYRAVGFIHDEILVELPDEGGFVKKETVLKVIDTIKMAMEEVTQGVPVSCDAALSTCWSKDAEWIVQGDHVLPWAPAANTDN